MTKVYLIRHGKTQWNLESRYQGANGDSPLLDQSYKEIELLAESLKNVPINHVYASPLKRARVTAMTLLQHLNRPVPLTIDSRLKEFNLGKMEGMHFESCQLTESRMYIKVVNTRLQAEVVPGDIVQSGIIISNSEVGLGSVNIQPLVYRLVCSNGMVVLSYF